MRPQFDLQFVLAWRVILQQGRRLVTFTVCEAEWLQEETTVVSSHESRRSRTSYVSSVALTTAPCRTRKGLNTGYVRLFRLMRSACSLPYMLEPLRQMHVAAISPSANTSAWLLHECCRHTLRSHSSPGAISHPSSNFTGTLPSRLYAC